MAPSAPTPSEVPPAPTYPPPLPVLSTSTYQLPVPVPAESETAHGPAETEPPSPLTPADKHLVANTQLRSMLASSGQLPTPPLNHHEFLSEASYSNPRLGPQLPAMAKLSFTTARLQPPATPIVQPPTPVLEETDMNLPFPAADARSWSTTLTKTHGYPQGSQPGQESAAVWPSAVSVPLHQYEPPARDPSPATNNNNVLSSGSPAQRPLVSAPSYRAQPSNPHPPLQPQMRQLQQAGSAFTVPRSRPHSASSGGEDTPPKSRTPESVNQQRRRSWIPGRGNGGVRLRSRSHGSSGGTYSAAWILSPDAHVDYSLDSLVSLEKVPELWDDNGSLYVYLSTPQGGRGPSFKVHLAVVESSRVLAALVTESQALSIMAARSRARSFDGRDALAAADPHQIMKPPTRALPAPSSAPFGNKEFSLYLPVSGSTASDSRPTRDRLVALRNLFAFLTGQTLVATRAAPSYFAVLGQIANLLNEFEFGSSTGSGSAFGAAVDIATAFYVDQAALADVRDSLEKMLEALALGEQLRFWPLYNEAFCHAVGKYSALRHHKRADLWDKISPYTVQRLERAHLDLLTRRNNVNTRLEEFDFPSLFAGVANSNSNPEYRHVRFKTWRAAFADMRTFALKYYKTEFGSWPPKANNRHNPFSEGGLNRLALKTLYADLCSVYDLLVNRHSHTTRAEEGDVVPGATSAPAKSPTEASTPMSNSDASIAALRQVLSEFDQSSPPVLPPMPFDTPKLPTMATIHETYPNMSPKEQARFDKNVHPYELQLVLLKSHNIDAERRDESSFLAAFEDFELREARKGKSEIELTEMRIGYWLFLYVMLQSLPMVIIDAPGLRFTDAVEYFLCEPLQGRPPWLEDVGEVRRAWFHKAGGTGPLVEISEDVLLYSVEATYRRSHCWLAAAKWEAAAAGASLGAGLEGLALVQASDDASAPASDAGLVITDLSSMRPEAAVVSLATGSSATPSPQLLPIVPEEHHGEKNPSARSTPPVRAELAPGRDSPSSQPLNQLHLSMDPIANAPWPQHRDNYRDLQERAYLRHASVGWALAPAEPLLDDENYVGPRAMVNNARRIASAGNLRTRAQANSNADVCQPVAGEPGSNHSDTDVFNTESTFDSILGNIGTDSKKKKRNSFLPFI